MYKYLFQLFVTYNVKQHNNDMINKVYTIFEIKNKEILQFTYTKSSIFFEGVIINFLNLMEIS